MTSRAAKATTSGSSGSTAEKKKTTSSRDAPSSSDDVKRRMGHEHAHPRTQPVHHLRVQGAPTTTAADPAPPKKQHLTVVPDKQKKTTTSAATAAPASASASPAAMVMKGERERRHSHKASSSGGSTVLSTASTASSSCTTCTTATTASSVWSAPESPVAKRHTSSRTPSSKAPLVQEAPVAAAAAQETKPRRSRSAKPRKVVEEGRTHHHHHHHHHEGKDSGGEKEKKKGTTPAAGPVLDYRQKVIREIITTEESYVSDLGVIVKVIMPLVKEKVPPSDCSPQQLFSCVEVLLGFNQMLLTSFKGDEDNIGKCFMGMAQFLKMYTVYAVNEPKAEEVVDQLLKKASFRAFLLELHAMPELHRQKMRDFLIKPVQRLCKYPLLLRELLKNTPQTHPDHGNIGEAMQRIEAAVAAVNEGKRADEVNSKVVLIQSRLEGGPEDHLNIIEPTRRFLMEKSFKEIVAPSNELQETTYILFNDLLLRVKPTVSGKLTLKSRISKDMLLVASVDLLTDKTRELPPAVLQPMAGGQSGVSNLWLFDVTHVGVGKFTVVADSAEERREWVEAIEKMIAKTLEDEYNRFARTDSFDRDAVFNMGRMYDPACDDESSGGAESGAASSVSSNSPTAKGRPRVGSALFRKTQSPTASPVASRATIFRASTLRPSTTGSMVRDALSPTGTPPPPGRVLPLPPPKPSRHFSAFGLDAKTRPLPPVPPATPLLLFRCFFGANDMRYVKVDVEDDNNFAGVLCAVRRKFAVDPQQGIGLFYSVPGGAAAKQKAIESDEDLTRARTAHVADLTVSAI